MLIGVRLSIIGTDSQVERFTGAAPGTIARCKAISDAYWEMAQTVSQDEAYDAYKAMNAEIERIDPTGAFHMLHGEPFGRLQYRFSNEERSCSGSAQGAEAVAILMVQRNRYPEDPRNMAGLLMYDGFDYQAFRRKYRDMCDRVALWVADGRLGGLCWG